ncbi:FKBP-type peptidyl-prolyl cis-trans isomerase [Microbacterium sp. RU33B]|uniref:FKBP-type peptidyl-prolyl cis-trans isomerase n=1 Tax=Microbacterium sp. RU33B TaxID=1907390 RepID=UPI0021169EA0|nr:FKBP-type peptidyl-prolyl cis-trans isomerase [Microbacterium sp. RU33B]
MRSSTVRIRPLAALSVAALSVLLLAGCSGASEPDASGTQTPAAGECTFGAPSGATSDAIEVEGVGAAATVTVPADLEFAELERTVLSEGDGEEIVAGDLVTVTYQIVDAATGEVLEDSATSPAGDGEIVPMLLDPQAMSIFVAALECAPLGSQSVLAIPGAMLGEGAASVVVVAQAEETLPTVATGADQEPVAGMPAVTLDEDGKPTITIPDADAPATVEIALLKKGDGETVAAGDAVVVQYEGVKWSDGTVFDGSWQRGTPSQFQTTGVVAGFRQALEGQQVGSQVLVVIPPEFGYGEKEGDALQFETLVFVVDILAVQHAATQ